jgi:integrase
MQLITGEPKWEKTNVTNLLRNRQSGNYYARVRVNGKQKWRSLETSVFSVAKLKLGDVEKDMRASTLLSQPQRITDRDWETSVERFIAIYLERTKCDPSLAPNSKLRREIAVKAIIKTWPALPSRDARRLSISECQTWAAKAAAQGTGFIAPNAKTVRTGMSVSAYNKCVDTLRAIFEIAREHGMMYQNPARNISKGTIRQKLLDLPSSGQFQSVVNHIAAAGARWSKDCADMAQILAFSGARLREATALRWSHIDSTKNRLTIPGTKSNASERQIPIFPPLAAHIAEMRARRGNEPASKPILRVSTCLGALKSACRHVGIKTLTHHDLRHYFATRCIESGVDIPTVSRWLGHSDGGALAMKVYGHLRQEHSDAQAAKVQF